MRPRILVAALNWGLGHATRCIPIIKALQKQGAEVIIGSDGEALRLLSLAFPELTTIELPPYNIRYRYANMFVNIAPQLPKLFRVLQLERRFLARIIQSHKIDALISDNRYGLSHPAIPCVFITHQLNIQIPNALVRKWVNSVNHRLIRKFQECWIPDFEESPGLSGQLAHPPISISDKDKQLRYLGPLSRLEVPIDATAHKPYDIVAILSGPEPQRTYFEKKLLLQMAKLPLNCLLVRGKLDNIEPASTIPNVELRNFLQAEDIAGQMHRAGLLVARSGYSTLMDMAKIGCQSALLIPTPGQTEQEYLAATLAKGGKVLAQKQQKINLQEAWAQRKNLSGFYSTFNSQLLENAVLGLLKRIKK